jgi:hypothetical protein
MRLATLMLALGLCGLTAGCTVDFGPRDAPPGRCGDGVVDATEVCDGSALEGQSCESLGYGPGVLACAAGCAAFDTRGCASPCGNGTLEASEVCDGANLDGQTCAGLGFVGGDLACAADCAAFDTRGCEGTCGDGLLGGDEVCDGDLLGGSDCTDVGYYGGALGCRADCAGFDVSGCAGTCGDQQINGEELCDGLALGGAQCADLGYYGGELGCRTDCSGYIEADCVGRCGDQQRNGPEVCDGADLGGATCGDFGYQSGQLACRPDCGGFDEAGCSGQCGDQQVEGTEVCDGANLDGQTCGDRGYYGGTLACQGDCADFDVSGCFSTPRVVINEVGVGFPDWVELRNLSEIPVDLQQFRLEWRALGEHDQVSTDTWTLPSYSLGVGERVVLEDDISGSGGSPLVTTGHIQFQENINWGTQAGSALLSDHTGAPLDFVRWGGDRFAVPTGASWTDAPPGLPAPGQQGQTLSLSRVPDGIDTDSGADFCVAEGTAQLDNNEPCIDFAPPGALLITEVFPAMDQLELHNPGPVGVDLADWQIKYADHTGDRRPLPSYVLGPGQYVMVDDDAPDPSSPYVSAGSCHIGTIDLANFGGTLELIEPAAGAGVDFVCWGGNCRAPVAPSTWTGGGASSIPASESLGRQGTTDTDDAADWCVQSPSLGSPNYSCQ